MSNRITLDFETRSTADLKKQGAYKYSLDPATQPTCLAFKSREMQKPFLLRFKEINSKWISFNVGFKAAWTNFISANYLFCAHNAFFEQCIYYNILVKRYGWPEIPRHLWRCTAAKAAACALPRSLEGAGSALNLINQKDKSGYIAMMQTCKPTKRWNVWAKNNYKEVGESLRLPVDLNPPPKFLEPDTAPGVFDTLYEYCMRDVQAEEELDKRLPDLLPEEQEIWLLNQKLNWRGLKADVPTVKKITSIMQVETKTKLKELDTLTMGLVTKPGARQSILDFLAFEGIELPDIRAKTVDDILESGKLSEEGKKLLELRKALSKTSTKKYQSFLDRAGSDHRVRDILLYHGASTGRDTGTGIQPHNFPRGVIRSTKENLYRAVEDVIKYDVEMLRLIYGSNLSILFSSILRNMIVASDGFELFVADFSKIEVAVLWWVADNGPGLKILHKGLDPYKYMAAANTGKRYHEILDDGDERQLGKAQVLGCGFGMGKDKFLTTAWDMYRLKLTEEQAASAVKNYREANKGVPEMWANVEQAAVSAIEEPGKIYLTNKCKFFTRNGFLWIELPSKRKLAYLKPSLGWRETDYGQKQTIEFMGVSPNKKDMRKERTWGGTLTENIVQAIARDLMMQASVRLEKQGYNFLLSVHDEALTERKIGEGSVEEFERLMCERPKWADSKLPLQAKAWKGPRYRK